MHVLRSSQKSTNVVRVQIMLERNIYNIYNVCSGLQIWGLILYLLHSQGEGIGIVYMDPDY